MKIKIFLSSYYRSVIIFLMILFFSTISANEVKKVAWISLPNLDKLVHLSMYFTFSFVLIFDISKARLDFSTVKIFIVAALIALTYGGILEIIQGAFTKTRTADIYDFLFNVIGALLALGSWLIIKRSR